jgi:hypothetical protein
VRVIGLFLAGALASTIPMVAHAVPLGSDMRHLGTMRAAAIIKVWNGCGWSWHLVPSHWSQCAGYGFRRTAPPTVVTALGPNRTWGGPYGSRQPRYGGWQPYHGWQGSY